MTVIEVLANLLTILSVLLTVHLKKSLYPVGTVATVLFFYVFCNAHLYASAALQIYFTVIQLYGWWFWWRGDHGSEPKIGNWSWVRIAWLGLAAGIFTVGISFGLYHFTDAKTPAGDTAILVLSVLAQFLLDRKQMKNWIIWGVVDVISIFVYAGQSLWLTAAVYFVLLVNVVYGWLTWRAVLRNQVLS